MIEWPILIACVCCFCAVAPFFLFLRNLGLFPRPAVNLPGTDNESAALTTAEGALKGRLSLLIPARNEAQNLPGLLQSLDWGDPLLNEVIVLNDNSTDATSEVVSRSMIDHPKLRLENSPTLPIGWCGKQHACFQAAQRATGEILLFLDADVRLRPGALRAFVQELRRQEVHYLSGFPRQETEGLAEQAVLPLIQFVLLSYLPLDGLIGTNLPSFAAGCGQLVLCQRSAYFACGGHAAIRESRHDGLRLPRVFRVHGLRTGIFDASCLADCRMYQDWKELWYGLAKNATEGMAAPGLIGPFSVLLFFGQILPLPLLVWQLTVGGAPLLLALLSVATACSLLPRVMACARFGQPILGALLHPFGVAFLLAVQWWAFLAKLRGVGVAWKGRTEAPDHTLSSAPVSANP